MTREELFSLKLPAWDEAAAAEIRQRWDRIAKPLDSLGEFERIFVRIGGLTGDAEIRTAREGVSQCGQEVTAMVAEDLARGTSNVNRMAARAEVRVLPVDMGIAAERTPEGLTDLHVCRGTKDFLLEPAMTEQETLDAIAAGMGIAAERKACGDRILAAGEMGIGNTTTAAGPGSHPVHVGRSPCQILRHHGSDLLPALAHALAAERILPGSRRALVASHLGKERGMEIVYRELSLDPVIRAALALGEGSGAVMLFPLLDLADAVYDTKRTFAQIELEPYRRFH